MDSLATAIGGLSIPLLLAAVGFLAVGYAARVVRWWWMLRALVPGLRLSRCVGPYLASVAVNNVLPFRAGDAYRVLGFRQQLGSPATRVLGTIVVERLLDVALLVGIFAFCSSGLPAGALPAGVVSSVTWLSALCVGGAVLLVWLAPRLAALRQPPTRGPAAFLAAPGWWITVANQLAHLGDSLGLVRSAQNASVLAILTGVAWVSEGAVFVTVAAAVGSDPSPGAPWLSLAAGTLGTLIPSSPGYVGTFDYFAAQGFAAYGTAWDEAVVLALAVHAVLWSALTLAGAPFVILRSLGVSYHSESRGVRNATEPGR